MTILIRIRLRSAQPLSETALHAAFQPGSKSWRPMLPVLREKATTVLLHDIRPTRKANEINRTLLPNRKQWFLSVQEHDAGDAL